MENTVRVMAQVTEGLMLMGRKNEGLLQFSKAHPSIFNIKNHGLLIKGVGGEDRCEC